MHVYNCTQRVQQVCDVLRDVQLPALRELDIDSDRCQELLQLIVRNSPELRSIRIRGQHVSMGTSLHQIANSCPRLEDFDFRHLGAIGTVAVPVDDLYFLLSQCAQLKNVKLHARTEGDLGRLGEFGHLFVELDDVSRTDPSAPPTVGFLDLARCCPRLTSLYFKSSRANDLLVIANSCPLLKSLRLDGDLLSVEGIQALSRCCTELSDLHLGCECKLAVPLMKQLGRMERLESLELYACLGLDDACVVALATAGATLKRIEIDSDEIDGEGLTGSCFRAFEGAPISRTLEEFEFSAEGEGFSKDGIIAGLAACPNLREIAVGYDDCALGDAEIRKLCEGENPLPRLEKIVLYDDPGLTVDTLRLLMRTCTNTLKCILFIGFCPGSPAAHMSLADYELLKSTFPHITLHFDE
jgi:hypothetical protein